MRSRPAAKGSRARRAGILASVAVALLSAVGLAAFVTLDRSPEIDAAQRDAVASFARAAIEVDALRESVAAEFDSVGVDIRTTDYNRVFSVLKSVMSQQRQVVERMRAIATTHNATALAHTLFIDAYGREAQGYELLNTVAAMAQVSYPDGTARRLRRISGYDEAVSMLEYARRVRLRAFEELEAALDVVGLTLEALRAAN